MDKNKKTSLKDIAEKLNISPGTVSITLNGRGDKMRIASDTQKLILDTALQMGYPIEKIRKNKQTIGVNELPVIALFLPILTRDVISPYDRIMDGINLCIKEKNIGVEIIVCPFEYNQLSTKEKYMSQVFCTGAIIFSMSETDMDYLLKKDFDIPIVIFNRINDKYSTVYVDDYNIGYNIAKLFKTKGCKQAGLFSPNYRNKPILLRKMGFEDGCKDLHIELSKNNNVVCKPEHTCIEKHVSKIYADNIVPEMIFANMDDIGLGLIKSLEKYNIKTPDDVKIISYGDNSWIKAITPSMSSIKLDIEGMSCECLEILWQMIQTGQWTPNIKIFQSKIIFRESFSL